MKQPWESAGLDIASGRHDSYSDIDLMVSLSRPLDQAPVAVGAFASRIAILCHRPFSSGYPPSGRFWFRELYPLHRLDVSFHTADQLSGEKRKHNNVGAAHKTIEGRGQLGTAGISPFAWSYSAAQDAIADGLHRLERLGLRPE